jgi:hypothetical protein
VERKVARRRQVFGLEQDGSGGMETTGDDERVGRRRGERGGDKTRRKRGGDKLRFTPASL